MAQMRKWSKGPVTFTAPYFHELLTIHENGYLPADPGAHALWYYYMLASKAKRTADRCMVLETDLSPTFTLRQARQLFETVANINGVPPAEMGRYWEAVDKQRRGLGLTSNADLPEMFRFKQ